MARPTKSIGTLRKNLTKDEIFARLEAESMVVTNATSPKPNDIVKSNPAMKKLFNQLKKLNDHFTESDSIALNTLVFNMYLKSRNERKLSELDDEAEDYERYLIRIEKLNKLVNETMKQLCIPLNARLSLANDMAKIMVEERKLSQIEEANREAPINPLLAVLEAAKNMK